MKKQKESTRPKTIEETRRQFQHALDDEAAAKPVKRRLTLPSDTKPTMTTPRR